MADEFKAWSLKTLLDQCDNRRERSLVLDAFAAGLKAAEEAAQAEGDEYARNAARCDETGNVRGGTGDTHGALACRAVVERIRTLAESPSSDTAGKRVTERCEKCGASGVGDDGFPRLNHFLGNGTCVCRDCGHRMPFYSAPSPSSDTEAGR
jgi:ribosomal protein S14